MILAQGRGGGPIFESLRVLFSMCSSRSSPAIVAGMLLKPRCQHRGAHRHVGCKPTSSHSRQQLQAGSQCCQNRNLYPALVNLERSQLLTFYTFSPVHQKALSNTATRRKTERVPPVSLAQQQLCARPRKEARVGRSPGEA